MGFLSELKKLLFVKKSVAKSAADKTVDFAKEKGDQILDSGKDLVTDFSSDVTDKASGLRDAIFEKSKNLVDSGKDALENVTEAVSENEMVKKAADFTESVGSKVMDKSADLTDKVKDFTEDVGSKVMDKGADLTDKMKDLTEDVGSKVLDKSGDLKDGLEKTSESLGSKVLDAKDALVDRAQEVTDKLGDKLSETIEKAEAFQKAEAAKPKRDFAEETLTTGDSFIEGKDDFFSKADKYADGDYGAFSEGKISIEETSEGTARPIAKAAGFEDLDGDGNEMIDDAIISEEE